MKRVLVLATSRKTRGGITSVVNAHSEGELWLKYQCKWIQTHRDGPRWRKVCYFIFGTFQYIVLLPFYDIVHMHVSFAGSLTRKCIYMLFAKLMKKNTIVHFHPPTSDVLCNPTNQRKYYLLFKNADKVLVLSRTWKEMIEQVVYGEHLLTDKRYQNIEVLYNPCPKIGDEEIVPILDRGKYILFAGTLIIRKGYKCLISAFSRIAKCHLDWKVILAGVDEEHQAINLIKSYGIEDQVELVGWCERGTMMNLYKNAGIFCLPSSGEGFPMSVLEAWAYGTPVICTPVGGLPDFLIEGENALIFDYNDEITLAKHLNQLINDVEMRENLSKGGRALAKTVFDEGLINEQLCKIYETI